MLRVLLYALPIVLAVYALVDLVQTDEEDVQGLPKLVWVVLIVLIWVIGPIAWLVAGKRGRRTPSIFRRSGPQRSNPSQRPLAPDDDPDFLRGLRYQQPPRSADPGGPPEAVDPDEDDTPEPPLASR